MALGVTLDLRRVEVARLHQLLDAVRDHVVNDLPDRYRSTWNDVHETTLEFLEMYPYATVEQLKIDI